MKKKNFKKVIAGMGIATMLGCGVVATGCADISLTQEQVDKIVSVVDNSDKFMDETLDLLESSNEKLDKESIVNLYKLANVRLTLNKDNVWDNMRFAISSNIGEELAKDNNFSAMITLFKRADGNRLIITSLDENADGEYDTRASYDSFSINEILSASEQTETSGDSEQTETSGDMATIASMPTFTYVVGGGLSEFLDMAHFEKEDIVDYKVLGNGNYYITAVCEGKILAEQQDQTVIVECEITQDGYMVAKKYYCLGQLNDGYEKHSTTVSVAMTFEYGTLIESEVQAEFDSCNEE